MLRIELLVDARNELGEGPLWDVSEQRLYWIDSHGAMIHRADARGQDRKSWKVPEHIGSMCLRENGGAVVALRNGFHFLDFDTGAVSLISDPEATHRRTRMNDGKVDRQGRFLVGTMDYEEREPLAGLYRLDPDLRITRLEESIIVSNGPCWSPDGGTFYFADSFRRTIWSYQYDQSTGDLLSRRTFANFEGHLRGFPDGATVDEEGFVWSVEVY
ncbi:MAG TPA: SMP-30/gluconolactonase/LRE family protein, partial [Acetobacteraceae bacterium]|nr:SMP-30/gluconolactonase/LRE family protein [Acetobacteraceae bacterium]